MNSQLVSLFNSIRDIPYSIPLSLNATNNSCSGKCMRLKGELEKLGYKVNYRVCDFFRSELELPAEIQQVEHEDRSTHVYLEVTIGDEIVTVDPTRDSGLSKIMHVNQWDGISNTNIAVHPIKLYSLEESDKIMNSTSEDDVQNDLSVNKDFYNKLNQRFSLQRVI